MKKSEWIVLFITCGILYSMWIRNLANNTPEDAKFGLYSEKNKYQNISPMKQAICTRLTVDLLPVILFSLPSSSFFSIEEFDKSVVGKSLFCIIGYVAYFQIIQPYVVNYTSNAQRE